MYAYIVEETFINETTENVNVSHGLEGTPLYDQTFTSENGSVRIYCATIAHTEGKRFKTLVAASANNLEMIRFMMSSKRQAHAVIMAAIQEARNV